MITNKHLFADFNSESDARADLHPVKLSKLGFFDNGNSNCPVLEALNFIMTIEFYQFKTQYLF